MNKNLYVDIHVLQNVPPSCVNRDDTGSPKMAVYGGTPRARVSSQAWKRVIREDFKRLFPEGELGKRTKHIVELVKNAVLQERTDLSPEKAEKLAITALTNAGLKIKDAEKGTDALFFISASQVQALARLVIDDEKDKKAYKEALKENPSVDMIMFGRMAASDPSLNYDATVQVAHSISTHIVHNEYDYFTAVDDCSRDDNAGAGHLGTVEFNSAVLYRYATVNVRELANFTGEKAARATRNFVESFVYTMPTGKENTFANRTLPSDIYITLRQDQPVNLCGAFEKAVPAGTEGYIDASEKAFAKYTKDLYRQYGNAPVLSFGSGKSMELLNEEDLDVPAYSVPDLLNALENALVKQLEDEK